MISRKIRCSRGSLLQGFLDLFHYSYFFTRDQLKWKMLERRILKQRTRLPYDTKAVRSFIGLLSGKVN